VTNSWITWRARLGDVVETVPGARRLFVEHGIDPTTTCASRVHAISLAEAVEKCGVRDVDELIRDLNGILAQII
jgi:hypothetical protein